MRDEGKALLGLLGLAQRAGAIASGEEAARIAMDRGKALLILIDTTASDNTKKRFSGKGVTLYEIPEGLGEALGKPTRKVCALIRKDFERPVLHALETLNNAGVHSLNG